MRRLWWQQVSGPGVTVFGTGDQYSFWLFLGQYRSVSTEAVLRDCSIHPTLMVGLIMLLGFLLRDAAGMWALPKEAASTGW